MKRPRILVTLAAIICAGCSSGIQISHVADDDTTVTGNPWNLAMTQFTVTITREVTGCGATFKGSVQVTASPTKIPDTQQRYALDSNGWWATSDITSNLAADGTSTGLNASSADATATVVSNVVGTVLDVVVGAAAGAPAHGLKAPVVKIEVCSSEVKTALADMEPSHGSTLKGQVDADTTALTTATASVTALTTQATADSSYKKALAKAIAVQLAVQTKLTAVQSQLAKDLKVVSDTQVVNWPLLAKDFRADDPFMINKGTFIKWAPHADSNVAQKNFSVYLALYRQGADGKWTIPPEPAIGDVSIGIPVRLARTGRLLACTGTKCPDALDATGDWLAANKSAATSFDQPVLQLGRMYNIAVHGGTFKSEGAVIALDVNGLPTSIETSEKTAAASTLSGSVKDTVGQVTALPSQIAAARLAATQAQSNQLSANSALATAVANARVANETAPLVAQTAVDTAISNQQTALVAIAAAQANEQVASQNSALAAQTSVINAEAAQYNAIAALAKARAVQ